MATDIRKHFELDLSALEEAKDGADDPNYQQELKRSMDLKRRLTKFQSKRKPQQVYEGFEQKGTRRNKTRASRCDLTT